jgi:hypothetical protein
MSPAELAIMNDNWVILSGKKEVIFVTMKTNPGHVLSRAEFARLREPVNINSNKLLIVCNSRCEPIITSKCIV